jgi:hypothetical protein
MGVGADEAVDVEGEEIVVDGVEVREAVAVSVISGVDLGSA